MKDLKANSANAAILVAVATALCMGSAAAENNSAHPPVPPGDPKRTVPEDIAPPQDAIPSPKTGTQPAAKPNEPLSEKLDRTDGVIRPPQNIDRAGEVPPPSTPPGVTPVIPPPGFPGNPSPVVPK